MMENRKRKPLDILHGSIWNKLSLFALPVAETAILEQLFNKSFDFMYCRGCGRNCVCHGTDLADRKGTAFHFQQ